MLHQNVGQATVPLNADLPTRTRQSAIGYYLFMNMFNSSKSSAIEQELPAPESDSALAEKAIPMGELVTVLLGAPSEVYGVVRKSRASTSQSDYFRVQFRAYAEVSGRHWKKIENEDAIYHHAINCAWAAVDHPSKSVTFGPRSGISCGTRFQSSKLDSYLFSQVISWAKSLYPGYAVVPGGIVLSTKGSMEERIQRSAFYASQGFDFDWLDEEQRTGRFSKERVGKLLGAWDTQTISEVNGEVLLENMSKQAKEHIELDGKLSTLQSNYGNLRNQLRKERSVNQVLVGLAVFAILIGIMFLVGIL